VKSARKEGSSDLEQGRGDGERLLASQQKLATLKHNAKSLKQASQLRSREESQAKEQAKGSTRTAISIWPEGPKPDAASVKTAWEKKLYQQA